MFWTDGIVCCFVVFSSSCQTLLCFGQTVVCCLLFSLVVVRLFYVLDRRYCFVIFSIVVRLFMFGQTVLFVIFSSSCQTLLCFGQTVLFVIFSSSCQTLLCFGQTVLFVVLLFSLVVVRLFYVLDRRYCLLFCYFL